MTGVSGFTVNHHVRETLSIPDLPAINPFSYAGTQWLIDPETDVSFVEILYNKKNLSEYHRPRNALATEDIIYNSSGSLLGNACYEFRQAAVGYWLDLGEEAYMPSYLYNAFNGNGGEFFFTITKNSGYNGTEVILGMISGGTNSGLTIQVIDGTGASPTVDRSLQILIGNTTGYAIDLTVENCITNSESYIIAVRFDSVGGCVVEINGVEVAQQDFTGTLFSTQSGGGFNICGYNGGRTPTVMNNSAQVDIYHAFFVDELLTSFRRKAFTKYLGQRFGIDVPDYTYF